MNTYQKTAMAHHCRFGFETAQPRFAHLEMHGRISVILTVNSGWE